MKQEFAWALNVWMWHRQYLPYTQEKLSPLLQPLFHKTVFVNILPVSPFSP